MHTYIIYIFCIKRSFKLEKIKSALSSHRILKVTFVFLYIICKFLKDSSFKAVLLNRIYCQQMHSSNLQLKADPNQALQHQKLLKKSC